MNNNNNNKNKCEICKFYEPYEIEFYRAYGICRRFPPVLVQSTTDIEVLKKRAFSGGVGIFYWPETSERDYCGEFQNNIK